MLFLRQVYYLFNYAPKTKNSTEKKILIDLNVKSVKCIFWPCCISKYFLNFTQGDYGNKVRTCLCNVNVFRRSMYIPALSTLEISVSLFPSWVSHSPEVAYVYWSRSSNDCGKNVIPGSSCVCQKPFTKTLISCFDETNFLEIIIKYIVSAIKSQMVMLIYWHFFAMSMFSVTSSVFLIFRFLVFLFLSSWRAWAIPMRYPISKEAKVATACQKASWKNFWANDVVQRGEHWSVSGHDSH